MGKCTELRARKTTARAMLLTRLRSLRSSSRFQDRKSRWAGEMTPRLSFFPFGYIHQSPDELFKALSIFRPHQCTTGR